MERRGYKRYLDPESNENIPRKSKYRTEICNATKILEIMQDDEIIQPIVNSIDQECSQHDVLRTENNETTNSNVITADWEQRNLMLCVNRELRNPSVDETLQTFFESQDNEIIQPTVNRIDHECLQYDDLHTESTEMTNSVISEDWEQNNIMLGVNRELRSNSVHETLQTLSNSQTTRSTSLWNICDNTSKCNNILAEKHLCACKNATSEEAILMCLKLGIRHSLDWCTIIDCFNMINIISQCKVLPNTTYKLFKRFLGESKTLRYNIYCKKCYQYIGEFVTLRINYECACGEKVGQLKKKSYFVMLDLKIQLTNLLQNPHIIEALQYRCNRKKITANALEDLYNGSVYKEMPELNCEQENIWNLSYMFNLDGCKAANSSKTTIWPIYITINELPPHLRFKNTLLVALWADNCEPRMNIFLQPFIKLGNELSTVGLTLRLPNHDLANIKLFPICCCVDSIARAAILNMKQFNGRYGCTFCEHPTERVDNQQKYPMLHCTASNRTDASIKKYMIDAYSMNKTTKKKQDIKGVWGPSCLMNLKYFDLVKGMVPDYMHSVLLGVMKQYTEIILSPENKKKKFYVGTPSHIDIIDDTLMRIKIPKLITRYPRSIKERSLWKASEWRNWLHWYCLICLKPILPSKYVKHLALLVMAVNMCLQKSITLEMIECAEKLFLKFVKIFQKFFGKDQMTYNIHLLLHITTSIRNWGPLWTHNAFPFENENYLNRLLLKLKKSPKDISIQISRRFLIHKLASNLSVHQIPLHIKHICNSAVQNKAQPYCNINNCILLGCGKEYILTAEEKNCLGYTVRSCKSYKKILYNDITYTCHAYSRHFKRNHSIVILKDGSIGQIETICTVLANNDVQIVIFLRKFEIDDSPFLCTKYNHVTHIKQCNINNTCLITCTAEDLEQPCIVMINKYHCYVSTVPYGCLGD